MKFLIPQDHNGKPFKDLTRVYIDFEYNGTKEERYNLVCVSVGRECGETIEYADFWLHKDKDALRRCKELMLAWREDSVFVAFNVVAEATAFISLGLDPTKFAWIDLQLEWKMLINHNHKYMYGNHLIEGKRRRTKPPLNKYQQTEEERRKSDNSKPPKNLAGAVYHLLGEQIDTEHKDAMRDLIISAPQEFTDAQIAEIMKYCRSDVEVLIPLRIAIFTALRQSPAATRGAVTLATICNRGKAAARTALISAAGYPVSKRKVENFARSVGRILEELAEDINSQFPENKIFEWNKSRGAYTMKRQPQYDFIKQTPYADRWVVTDTGQYSLSLEAWAKHYSYRHDYPRGDMAAQIIRFLKTKQNLNGFMPTPKKGKRKNFFDSYGSDGRARAWLNPYGSQSSRFQPQATGFIPLKSAWMRSLIEPPPGFVICGMDYASEEFLISALLSRDTKMFESYASGDPYLAFAKFAGAVPPEGTKETHSAERNRFKSTCLAEGSLIRVRGEGFLPIERITANHEVWDGDAWRKSQGAKLMGYKPVIKVENIKTTSDHLILTEGGWDSVRTAKKTCKHGEVFFQDAARLPRPSASWSEVWAMARLIVKDALCLFKKRGA